MRYIFLFLVIVGILKAEFISTFDNVQPVDQNQNVLGVPVEVDNTNSQTQESILGESVKQVDKPIYKEIGVEELRGYGELKVALLIPKRVIKGYAKRVSNSILGYLIYKNEDFTFEVFDSKDESEQNILDALFKIKSKGYKYIIAPVTPVGAQVLANYEKDLFIYIPTLHRSLFPRQGNIYYGGIDYKKQIDKLLNYANGKIAVFMGKSWLAQRLTDFIQERNYDIYVKAITTKKINPKHILKNNYNLNNASIFFNMPLVHSALLLSSFSTYSVKPYRTFSTQINYSPLLFTMVQKRDRQNFYIANSIGYVNSKLRDIDQNLGLKIKYDWVSYSSSIGIDYIYSRYYGVDPIFNEDLRNHQVRYRVNVVKISGNEFVKVK